MPELQISAYYYSEDELTVILEHLNEIARTESYVIGTTTPAGISALREKGVLLDILEEVINESKKIPRTVRTRSISSKSIALNMEPDSTPVETPYYVISFLRFPDSSSLEQLDEREIEILERIQNQIYKVKVADPEVLQEFDFIGWHRPFGNQDKDVITARSVVAARDVFDIRENKISVYDVLLHQSADTPALLNFLSAESAEIISVAARKIRVKLENNSMLQLVGERNEVNSIEEYIAPELHNDLARIQLHLDPKSPSDLSPDFNLTGADQIVGVADTGIDENHPDLADRVQQAVPLGRLNDYSDPNGHGTHVTGSIAGTGAASQGLIKGIAPEAKVYFQSLMDEQGRLAGIPADLQELFRQAYQEGVRIHNNSWGAATESEYRFNSMEVDEFVYHHKDMLIVISSGNEGTAFQPRNSQPGFVDWLSLGSPATSKNALSVGASRSTRNQGGFSNLTHGQAWPGSYPDLPIRDQKISGDPESIAGFSSRGPCGNESRIKPDLVAPGTDIASTKSSLAPSSNFWGPYPNNRNYAFMGGTSMSAPIVSGFAALVREYLTKSKNHTPSAALLKAIIINGCRQLKGPDALADHDFIPNFHQGFGCIDMLNTLPNELRPELRLQFMDTWEIVNLQFNSTGQRFLFRFELDEGLALRLCLTWTDPPGRGLQNNLNLLLLHKETDFKWIGNDQLPRSITSFDRDNNVEIIRLDDPQAGEYWVAVQANNLIFRPQDFALAVSGNLKSDLEQIS